MKLTTQRLKKLIKEELEKIKEAEYYFDPDMEGKPHMRLDSPDYESPNKPMHVKDDHKHLPHDKQVEKAYNWYMRDQKTKKSLISNLSGEEMFKKWAEYAGVTLDAVHDAHDEIAWT